MEDIFILILPSYEDFPDYGVVADFLNFNSSRCLGVVGTGNMNFGDLYLCTAKEICRYYDLPLLYGVEFSGTDKDVEGIKTLVTNLTNRNESV